MSWFKRSREPVAQVLQDAQHATGEKTMPAEGVPPWVRTSLFEWLEPILYAVEDSRYHSYSGTPSIAFLTLAERRLRFTLEWSGGERGAIHNLKERMNTDEALFLKVVDLAIENIELGYSFQDQREADARLAGILNEAGSVWRLNVREEASGQRGSHTTYRTIRSLQRRTVVETGDALRSVSQRAPGSAAHIASAWNYAFGRNPDPGRAYSEAIKAVEAAAIPIISPNNSKATLGSVIGQLRSTPQKWQVVLARGIDVHGGEPTESIEIVTNLAALLWVNQADRHAPVQPIQQRQAEMAVHIALTLVQVFTQSITPVP